MPSEPDKLAPASRPAVSAVKQGGALLSAIGRGAKFMARVPGQKPFAPTFGQGVRNAARVAFNPYLGRHMELPKRLLQGTALWSAGNAALGVRQNVRNLAGQVHELIPDTPQTQATKGWTQDLRDWPVLTATRTALLGLPEDIPQPQRDLLTQLGSLGLKSKVHGKPLPKTWRDVAHTVYSPALQPALSLGQRLLQRFVPAPNARDYVDLGRSAVRSFQTTL